MQLYLEYIYILLLGIQRTYLYIIYCISIVEK
jgi:hypothetical protein